MDNNNHYRETKCNVNPKCNVIQTQTILYFIHTFDKFEKNKISNLMMSITSCHMYLPQLLSINVHHCHLDANMFKGVKNDVK